jgi:thiol-disulfide isomerase/thioredoxin
MDSVSSVASLQGGASKTTKTALIVVSSVLFLVGIALLIVMITRKTPEGETLTPQAGAMKKKAPSAPKPKSRMAMELMSEQEARDALGGSDPAMVFIYADWCGFCKKADPVYAELAQDPAYKHVKLLKLNSTKATALAKERGVSGFPTFLTNWGEGKYVGYKDKVGMQNILKSSKNGGGARVAPSRHTNHHRMRAGHAMKRGQQVMSESEAVAALQGSEPVVVFVSSESCGFCKKLMPVWEEVAADNRFNHVKMLKIDSKNAANLIKSSGITGFPTMLSNKGEKKYVGYRPKEKFEEMMVAIGSK